MEDWSELLPELLTVIAESIIFYEDFISFANVCASWRSAAAVSGVPRCYPYTRPSRYPSLMLAAENEGERTYLEDEDETSSEDESDDETTSEDELEYPEDEDEDDTVESEDEIGLCSLLKSLELAEKENKEDTKVEEERRFFLLSNSIRYVKLQEVHNVQCLSSRGWILTVAKNSTAKLVHPFSGRQINLPKLKTIKDYKGYRWCRFAMKLVLSSDFSVLSPKDFLVIACWARLGFWSPGADKWTRVRAGINAMILDITYHNGMVYTFDISHKIMSYDVHGKNPTSMELVSKMPKHYADCHRRIEGAYIVGLDDEKLIIVIRRGKFDEWNNDRYKDYPYEDFRTTCFIIYEFNLKTNEWLKVNDLGNKALFLGSNSSFWMEASASGDGCIKGDCIYFADDVSDRTVYKGGGRDMGIYHLCDGSIEPHFTGESISYHSPPLWVEPMKFENYNYHVPPQV